VWRGRMQRFTDVCARWRFVAAVFAAALLLAGCSLGQGFGFTGSDGGGDELNARPANYKPDILNAMHAYLNDPVGMRDAGIADPALKQVGGVTRYVVCVRYNARKNRKEYAGTKEVAAVFMAGRFDHFTEVTHEECAGAVYAPFPELEKLSR